jgi:hypothetical protein
MVRATPTARRILTTREHIDAQARGKSERLRNFELDDFRVFPRMPDYAFVQKARILYNHLYFSDLPLSTRANCSETIFTLISSNMRSSTLASSSDSQATDASVTFPSNNTSLCRGTTEGSIRNLEAGLAGPLDHLLPLARAQKIEIT